MKSGPAAVETSEFRLSGMAYGGEAFGRDEEGRMVFVPFACPGERVKVRVVESHKRWARAELVQVLEASSERTQPRCAHFGDCGGCHYQHLSYSAQLKYKREIVVDQLRRIGGMEQAPVGEIIPSPIPWNARNRMGFSLTPDGQIGLVGTDPDTVVRLKECHLPLTGIGEVWPKLEFEGGIAVDQITVRAGHEGEILIVLQGESEVEPDFTVELPVNVVWSKADVVHVVAGEAQISQKVKDTVFRVSANSFFQVNNALIPGLVEHLMALLNPDSGMRVFDLYAGVGLFSSFLAERAASIVAVEESPSACSDFEFNLRDHNQIALYQARVEDVLAEWAETPDAVILDPPRSGLARETVDHLVRLKPPRMLYISCDPATFARDAKRLVAGGFKLEEVIPYDLFPQTYHIEVLSDWTAR